MYNKDPASLMAGCKSSPLSARLPAQLITATPIGQYGGPAAQDFFRRLFSTITAHESMPRHLAYRHSIPSAAALHLIRPPLPVTRLKAIPRKFLVNQGLHVSLPSPSACLLRAGWE